MRDAARNARQRSGQPPRMRRSQSRRDIRSPRIAPASVPATIGTKPPRKPTMLRKTAIAIAALVLAASAAAAQAPGPSKYPNLKGQWLRLGAGNGNAWDPTQPIAHQSVPLIPEYQAIYDAARADEAAGGQGIDPTYICVPSGMP